MKILNFYFFVIFQSFLYFSESFNCSYECSSCDQEPEEGNSHCSSCKNSNLYLKEGNCVTKCAIGGGNSIIEGKKCIKCNDICDICSGESNNNLNPKCIACYSGHELVENNNNCIKCNENQYKFIERKNNNILNNNNEIYYYTKTTCVEQNNFSECPINMPILKKNEKICSSFSCNKNDFENGICEISNNIIKIQYLNEVIESTQDNIHFTYATKDNRGNLFILSASSSKSCIYGLIQSGNFYFFNSPFLEWNNIESFAENWGQIITIDFNNITNIILFYNDNLEFFDAGTSKKISGSIESVLGLNTTKLDSGNEVSYVHQLKSSSNSFLYYHFYISSLNFTYLSIKKYEIMSSDIDSIHFILMSQNFLVSEFNKYVDCYETDNLKMIVCSFINPQNKILIQILNNNLENQNQEDIFLYNNDDIALSFKAIHFKKEIGIFLYYIKDDDYNRYAKIILKNMKIENEKCFLEDYFEVINMDMYRLNDFGVQTSRANFDLVKLSENKFSYVVTGGFGEQIIIVMFTLYNNDNYIKIRYYSINTLLYFYQVSNNIICFNYNNFLGISFTKNKYKNTNLNEREFEDYKSSTIFLSYINNSNPNTITNFQIDFTFKLNNYTKIINNIFGYILSKFKVISLPQYNISTFSSLTGKKISIGDYLESNDEIFFDINYTTSNTSITHIFEYIPILTEPDYEEFNKYSIYSEDYPTGRFNEANYFIKSNYSGKPIQLSFILGCYKSCDTCESVGNEDVHKCINCKENYFKIDESLNLNVSNCYSESPEHFYLDRDLNFFKECDTKCKKCSEIASENNTNCLECSDTRAYLFNGNCIICENNYYFDEELEKCVECKCELKRFKIDKTLEELNVDFIMKLLEDYEENYYLKDRNIIIYHRNNNYTITLQRINLHDKTNFCISNYSLHISHVHLDDCYNKILEKNNQIENVINLQVDFRDNSNAVNYLLYSPDLKKILDLKVCKDMDVKIDKYIHMNDILTDKYLNLSSQGYNMLNINDKFYTDACTTFTTPFRTDIILKDRILDYYNISLPNEYKNCDYSAFNLETKIIKCEAKVETDFFSSLTKYFEVNKKNLLNNFFNMFRDSNVLVIKCYKLFFSIKGQTLNYGSYLLLIIIALFIINAIIFYNKGNKRMLDLIDDLIEKNVTVYNSSKQVDDNLNYQRNKKMEEKSKQIYNFYKTYFEYLDYKSRCINIDAPANDSRIRSNSNMSNQLNSSIKSSTSRINFGKNKDKEKEINLKKLEEKNFHKANQKTLNDYELNWLDYFEAIEIDKRLFNEYYWAILKRRHLILFSFYPNEDYNMKDIKQALFIVSFALFFSITTSFFRDESLHRFYMDKGSFNFYHFPRIIYSTIITSLFIYLLKLLSLSEKPILELKKCETKIFAKRKAYYLVKKLDIKFTFFYIISFSLLLFFWYYVGCFCCVYKNTQKIVLRDSIISFALSTIYPVFICMISSTLRLIALRDKLERKKCMYKFSQFLTLL